jgi:hypothetical protein
MELISLYLYNTCPIQTENINSISFSLLKNKGYEEDVRKPKNFFLIKKSYEIDDEHYRIFLRFSKNEYENSVYSLDYPVPFMIVKTKPTSLINTYKDEKIYHSNQHKKIYDYIKSGVPIKLFNEIFEDLKENIIYE